MEVFLCFGLRQSVLTSLARSYRVLEFGGFG
jgi:hypothetical protein